MENQNSAVKLFSIYQILRDTDADHRISMPQIQADLEEKGMHADRKSVYRAIEAMQTCKIPVCYSRADGKPGYWMSGGFTPAQALILCNAVQDSMSLSRKESDELIAKITGGMSTHQKELLTIIPPALGKSDDGKSEETMEILMKAAADARIITFRYFDITVSRQKKYRYNAKIYEAQPYAVVSNNGRYYCIAWSKDHESFINYRIDKMDNLTITDQTFDPRPFSLEEWMTSSFHMYAGKKETVQIEFDLNLASIVFDQFGQEILISRADDHTFTASFYSAISPTLTAWILQFYDRLVVKKPASLIEELRKISL